MLRRRYAFALRRIAVALLGAGLLLNAFVLHVHAHAVPTNISADALSAAIERVDDLAVAMFEPSQLKCCATATDEPTQNRCVGETLLGNGSIACNAFTSQRHGAPPAMAAFPSNELELLLRPPRVSL